MLHRTKPKHASSHAIFRRRSVAPLLAAAVVASMLLVPLSQTVGAPTASAQAPSCNGSPDGLSGNWTCTFDDEFNGTSLNTSLWQPELTATSGFITGGPDCYVDNPNTISVSGGYLNLSVVQTPPTECGIPGYDPTYEAGMVSTNGLFDQTYGAFEVRAKIPDASVQGLQETFWLYPQNLTYGPWPASGEIDFAEFYSQYSNYDIPYIHYLESAVDPNVTAYTCVIDPSQFNTYEVDWTPTTLTVLYNGQVCLSDTWIQTPGEPAGAPFNQPFMIALTQALGQVTNSPTPNTPLPATTQVDWVRAWEPAD